MRIKWNAMVDQSSVAMGVPSREAQWKEGFPEKLLSEQASQQKQKRENKERGCTIGS